MLSIVIPTLNAETTLEAALRPLQAAALADEIIVVDGGSTDGTQALAAGLGAKVRQHPPGRGGQIRNGCAAATGDWVLIVHADTALSEAWGTAAAQFMANPEHQERAGYFRLRLDDPHPAARRIERLANWRARTFGLPYGDQGLLLRKAFLDSLGGYPGLALMEDVALARALGRQRLVPLDAVATTGADRYRRDGWWARPLKNLLLLTRYFLGANPETLKRAYR